jgi:hypothetical protein
MMSTIAWLWGLERRPPVAPAHGREHASGRAAADARFRGKAAAPPGTRGSRERSSARPSPPASAEIVAVPPR